MSIHTENPFTDELPVVGSILEDLSVFVQETAIVEDSDSYAVTFVDAEGDEQVENVQNVRTLTLEEAYAFGGFLHAHQGTSDGVKGEVLETIKQKLADDLLWIEDGDQVYPASYDTLRYLPQKDQFDFEGINTEMPNKNTFRLSACAQGHTPSLAMEMIQGVDTAMLRRALDYVGMPSMKELRKSITTSLENGGNIILYGCGSTGRLSIALASIFRHEAERLGYSPDRVVCGMTGGEGALQEARENHEDSDEFARNQLDRLLENMDASKPHQVIGITEGGETTSVLAFVEHAKERIQGVKPYMVHTNNNEAISRFERSRRVIEDPDIEVLPLEIDPQALTGSTRMQSSTIQMMLVGLSIMSEDQEQMEQEVASILEWSEDSNYGKQLEGMLKCVSNDLDNPDLDVVFQTTPDLAPVLANDLSELNPTFRDGRQGLRDDWHNGSEHPSYYCAIDTSDFDGSPYEAMLAGREPNLYSGADDQIDPEKSHLEQYLLGPEDIHRQNTNRRSTTLDIRETPEGNFQFSYRGEVRTIKTPDGLSRLGKHVILKMILNSFSTTFMARRGRVEKNMMSYINCARPDGNITNYKLLNRTVRSIQALCEDAEMEKPNDDEVAAWIAFYAKRMPPDQSILLRVFEHFKKRNQKT